MIPEAGQDYDINITDARPDTGGLSGAPPSEAASWGKIDPTKLEETVTAYIDVTVAFPLLVAYVRQTTKPKKPCSLPVSSTVNPSCSCKKMASTACWP